MSVWNVLLTRITYTRTTQSIGLLGLKCIAAMVLTRESGSLSIRNAPWNRKTNGKKMEHAD